MSDAGLRARDLGPRGAVLRLLVRLKFGGIVRKHVRRLKSWRGALFALVGLVLFGGWLFALTVQSDFPMPPVSEATLEGRVRIGLLVFSLLSIGGALQHRGLYLPEEEIERLFAAPLTRADLVRYRLLINGLRALPGTLVIGLFGQRWLPDPLWGWVGLALAFQTLPVLNQLAAIVLGKLEREWANRLGKLAKPLMIATALGLGVTVYLSLTGSLSTGSTTRISGLTELFAHPAFRTVTLPAVPFWKIMSVPTALERAGWVGFVVLQWLFLAWLTVAVRVDFRELSLETAASVAQRIRRVRAGGSSWLQVDGRKRDGSRSLPFARGPFGAIVARKLLAIARKSQGTLVVSVLVLSFVVLLSRTTVAEDGAGPLGSAAFVAAVGALYLCSGLRFDFRDELARMEAVLAWPVSRARVFAAMILPQVLLVSALLGVALLAQALLFGELDPSILAVMVLVPPFVFNWSALDNVVWLLSPVKNLPGQEGALVHAGRSILMFLLRFLLMIPLGIAFTVVFFGYNWAVESLVLEPRSALLVAAGVLGIAFLSIDLVWVVIGGKCLGRFDLARDRG